jgi:hypothetical protein
MNNPTLLEAVYALLPSIQDVVSEHPANADDRQCRRCEVPAPCRHFDAAVSALDLVLRVRIGEANPRVRFGVPSPDWSVRWEEPMGTADPAAAARGLERLRIELITAGGISPDSRMALLTILGLIDIGCCTLTAEPDVSEMFAYGVLLGVIDRAVIEFAGLDPKC